MSGGMRGPSGGVRGPVIAATGEACGGSWLAASDGAPGGVQGPGGVRGPVIAATGEARCVARVASISAM